MNVGAWSISQVITVILAYWALLVLAVGLVARWHIRQSSRRSMNQHLRLTRAGPPPGHTGADPTPSAIELQFSESFSLPVVVLSVLGPPVALIIYWITGG